MTAPRTLDVKEILLGWLPGAVSAPVLPARPDTAAAPDRFVRLILTGVPGRHDRALQTAHVTVDSYAPTTAGAVALALAVDDVLRAAPAAPVPIVRVSGSSPAESPDPDTASARATATYQITTRLTA